MAEGGAGRAKEPFLFVDMEFVGTGKVSHYVIGRRLMFSAALIESAPTEPDDQINFHFADSSLARRRKDELQSGRHFHCHCKSRARLARLVVLEEIPYNVAVSLRVLIVKSGVINNVANSAQK